MDQVEKNIDNLHKVLGQIVDKKKIKKIKNKKINKTSKKKFLKKNAWTMVVDRGPLSIKKKKKLLLGRFVDRGPMSKVQVKKNEIIYTKCLDNRGSNAP